MASSSVASTTRRALERLAVARLDDQELRHESLAVLRRALPVDGWSWAMADPTTGIAVSALADHPLGTVVPGLLAAEDDAAEVSTRTALASSHLPVSSLSAATTGDLNRSVRWRKYLAPHGIGDELRIVFADASGCWSYLDLYTSGRSRYDAEHVRLGLLAALALTAALRHGMAMPRPGVEAHIRPADDGSNHRSAAHAPGVIVLDEQLRRAASTGPAAWWLASLPGTQQDMLPCAITATATRAINAADGAKARLRNRDGIWTTVQAAALDTGGFAVTIAHSSPHDVLDVLTRAAGMSQREREVMQLLYLGSDTRTIAQRLHIAESTAQDHVKKILAKSGQSSRRSLLASAYPPPAED